MTQQVEIGDRESHQNGDRQDNSPVSAVMLNNGVFISFQSEHGQFEGIGRVEYDGVALRDNYRSAFVDIRTPDGVQLEDWRVVRSEIGPDRILVDLTPMARSGGLMEWMLHETRPRINTADWASPPQPAVGTQLQLVIEPITRHYGDETAIGLRYQYHYESAEFPIYKIMDRSTWEPGGKASENEFWFRNSFAPSIYKFREGHQYSTEWYQPSASNCDIFQFLPWQTALEGFTLLFHDEGALVTWAAEVSHVRSYFEKPASTDALFHWHEHCGDLGTVFSSAPMEVLWFPGRRDHVARWNLYEAVREDIYDTLHADIGMRRDRITPYGVIEEWNLPDFDRYREKGLPKLLDAGMRTIFLPNEFENNMNTFGVSNMCCTIDYKVAETVREDSLTAFCRAAQQGGAKVEMWGNTALSTLTLIFANRNGAQQRVDFLPAENGSIVDVLSQSKDPYVRNASGAIESDHYTPVFAQLNLRDTTIRAYWMKQWKKAHDEVGIEGIFLDSSCNMTSDKFHWIANPTAKSGAGATVDQTHLLGYGRPSMEPARAILSQYRAHLELMAEMQQAGYAYCGEDIGIFGTHRSGPDIVTRLDNIPMWSDGIVGFDVPSLCKAGADPEDIFFKGLAYRMMWFVYWDIEKDELTYHLSGARGEFDRPSDLHVSLFRAYSVVDGEMGRREILPGEEGVLYTAPNGGTQILWTFKPANITLPSGAKVEDILSGETTEPAILHVEWRRIYRIILPAGTPPIILK